MKKSTLFDTIKSTIKSHPFIFVTLALFAFIVVVLFITAINIGPSTEIEVLVAPASATVEIDGKKYENGTYRFKNGEHQVYIEKDGFVSKDYTFSTENTSKLYDYLEQTDGSFSWYLDHESDALLLTQIGSYTANLEAEKFAAKYSVISKLPIVYANYDQDYNYTEYRIDGGKFSDCESDFCLKITDTTGGNLDAAKERLKEQGINPEDYEILYVYMPITPIE